MATSLINRIAINATGETALPTLPTASGSNISKTDWDMGAGQAYITLGSVERASDDANITDDSVEATLERVVEEIMHTRGLQRQDLILLQNRVTEFSIMCDDASEALWALASDIAVASNVAQQAAALTFRTVAIEMNGLCIDYYPKCAVFINSFAGGFGEGGKGTTELICMPIATSGLAGGHSREWY